MPKAEDRATLRRRSVLAAALLGSVTTLSGCGIRLASDAPHIPGIKEQGPPADQAVLRGLWSQLDTAIDATTADTSGWAKKLGALHRLQRTRLTQVMATQGMTPPPHTPQPTGPSVDPGALVSFEQEGARRVGSYVNLSTRNLPMAAAIAVTENAGATMLGHGIVVTGGTLPKPVVVKAILPELRAATYALEVIIAKTALNARTRAAETLTMLHATRATWEASLGEALPTAPDAYALPTNPTTDATRQQLAQHVLSDLIDACAGQVTATKGDPGAFIGLTTLWADTTAQLWKWAATPVPFPGLTG